MDARLLATAALAVLAACSSGTDGVPISALRPDFAVEIPLSGPSRVAAALYQGDRRFALYEWDRLSASVGGVARVLVPVAGPVGPSYEGAFPSLAEGDLAAVSFASLGAPGAVESSVLAPSPVLMTSPSAGVSAQVGGTLGVAWRPSATGDRVVVHIRATRCTGDTTGGAEALEVPDTGAADVPVPPGLLPPTLPPGGSCTAEVWVERARSGTVSAQFAPGGRIEARQISNPAPIAVVR
jgi:hypothetical protein